MSDQNLIEIIKEGSKNWNEWRSNKQHSNLDLTGANLSGLDLSGCNFKKVNLAGANFSNSTLKNADFWQANLWFTNLNKCNLQNSCFQLASLLSTDFSDADISNCDFTMASFVRCNMEGTIINNSLVYGVSVWDILGNIKQQIDLIITPREQSIITVDNLQVAQFIYLLLNNKNIRNVIDTITSKVVLILGRFTKERKEILDLIKSELRLSNYLPILFDFEKPNNKDLTETITTLAQISKFVIADITDAKSIPQELMSIIPHNPSIFIMPIIETKNSGYSMFEHFDKYPWVFPVVNYDSKEDLIKKIRNDILKIFKPVK